MKAKARAYANIALIKYWGKRDEKLHLPMNSSLSLTLDKFYSETEVEFKKDLAEDHFYLDGFQDDKSLKRVSEFLDIFRKLAGKEARAIVKSVNYVPTAAGLASSASGFAALAAATNKAIGLDLDKTQLSRIARRGSGSASRSIYGGFVEWSKGTDDKDSYGIKIDDGDWDIGMVVVIVNENKKKISSREAMKNTVLTSPFYRGWVEESEKDLIDIKEAILERDFERIGYISERNALKMHGTMLGAKPPIMYFEPESIRVMDIVHKLRKEGVPCFFTMDAGPNVKIICRLSQGDIIKKSLMKDFKEERIIITGSGPSVKII